MVDGAENTELALTVDKHGEVAKSYTYTEHQYTPDVYIISTKTWNRLTEEQQNYLVECLNRSNENFKNKYRQMMEEAIEEAKGMGMTIYYDIDKTAFIEAVQPLHEEYKAKGAFYQELYDDIEQYAGEGVIMKTLNKILGYLIAFLVGLWSWDAAGRSSPVFF